MSDVFPTHATCVAFGDAAVLIMGASGSGKSALGLTLMALGCTLVADDRVILAADDGRLCASCPAPIRGMIEARGVGLLKADYRERAHVVLVVDLDQLTDARLPQRRTVTLLGCEIPLIHRHDSAHFAPAILQCLKAGWSDE